MAEKSTRMDSEPCPVFLHPLSHLHGLDHLLGLLQSDLWELMLRWSLEGKMWIRDEHL